MLAVGMIIPVLPRLIGEFTHGDEVSTAQMLGIFSSMFAVMQFFFSPVLGALSDQFGRRPVVLLSNLGLGLDYLLMAWAPAMGWLFVGRVIAGLTASSVPTAMAYMTDVTPAEKRAAAFGMLNAAFGLGFVLGPAVGGFLGGFNPRLPFLVSSVLSILNALYGFFILPESLSSEHRNEFSWKRANPVGSISLLRRHHSMIGIAAVLLVAYTAQQSLSAYVIYADYRYHWTDQTVGISLGVVGLVAGLYGAFFVKRFVAMIGERGSILVGLAGGAAGYLIFGAAQTGVIFCSAIPLLSLTALVWPASQSQLSKHIGPSEQGQLQGAVNSLRGIAGLVGPGLFTYIFSRSIGPKAIVAVPGMPYFVACGFLLAALVIAVCVTAPVARTPGGATAAAD
jgi:DHA1 family tetracycline resistance protein-like MFS transporter